MRVYKVVGYPWALGLLCRRNLIIVASPRTQRPLLYCSRTCSRLPTTANHCQTLNTSPHPPHNMPGSLSPTESNSGHSKRYATPGGSKLQC